MHHDTYIANSTFVIRIGKPRDHLRHSQLKQMVVIAQQQAIDRYSVRKATANC